VLLAARINPNAEKTVLVYWQADGHSVDPAAWKWPNAFEPILKEEISTGHRGKIPWDSLDKGLDQGSPNLPDAVNCNRDLLAADMLLIFDGPPHASNKPTVVVGARGIMTVQLVTYGPITPQHSGHYGNYAPNPAPGLMARAGLQHLYGEEPILIRTMGGSIPIAPFVEALELPAAIVPTVNIDNNQHSPNENLRLGNFIEVIAMMMSVLGREP
jgi:acetylornithine deacetylase/succinyl-diaminopimelate desuccinylase-like protein